MATAIRRALAECNGGPGLTAEELAERFGCSLASMRTELAGLVFVDRDVTCEASGKRRAGRYRLGSSDALRMVT